MEVTVGTKYQIVIPKEVRKKIKSLIPGSRVNVVSSDGETIAVKPVKADWVKENYGAMKEYWKDIDPIKELEKMRNEWEERLEELEKDK
jgi:AbrB family looped-hinge helix DNA binding protein